MTTPLLSLRGLSKSYGQIRANQGIDLDVAEHSIHAILGENGAGKSTLMKLIYGVETPDEGTVTWQGEPIRLASPAEARRQGIGMVFQHFSLFETLTVVENIALVVPGRRASWFSACARSAAISGWRSIRSPRCMRFRSANGSGWRSSAA